MKNLWKSVLGLWVIGIVLGMVAPAQAASANGPYYATPSWDQKLDAATRFVVLSNWDSEAVLDRETGLVWEKSPSASEKIWSDAMFDCTRLQKGNRLGWRLPGVQELATLLDPSVPLPGPALPAGHPFENVQSAHYWSATTDGINSSNAWFVRFSSGNVDTDDSKAGTKLRWCVRGGQGLDAQ